MAYRSAEKGDRWKAMAAAVGVTAVVGAGILSGLNVDIIREAGERLETFDVALPEPPPEEPPPELQRDRADEEQGAAGRKAEPTPIVAPKPEIVLPPREVIAAAVEPGAGTASTSGAANSGTGPGAGGTGSGRGGGGSGAGGTGFTPAQLVRNLTRSDYRQLTGGRLPAGRAMVSLRVEPDGSASNCRVVRSSGDTAVDRGLCPLITRRLQFRAARDDRGRPIAYQLQYVATWRL